MKFFHVYNEKCYEGLVKNNLINEDSGFKIQHAFSVPGELKFNNFAAKGTKLHSMIKENKIPFYVDRITGGITYHKYDFDKELIREYESILGDWFLGFQLHESASNITDSDWKRIPEIMGHDGPYDLEELKKALLSKLTNVADGERLYKLSHGTPEFYAPRKKPHTVEEMLSEFFESTGITLSQLISYREHPIDKMHLILKNKLPVIMVCGDQDTVVPYHENGALLEKYYRENGGYIEVFVKRGCGHHPHGLPDNTPIVKFIEKFCL